MTLGDTAKLALDSAGGLSLTFADLVAIAVIVFVVGLVVVGVARFWQERSDEQWRREQQQEELEESGALVRQALSSRPLPPLSPEELAVIQGAQTVAPTAADRLGRVLDHHARHRSEPPKGAS